MPKNILQNMLHAMKVSKTTSSWAFYDFANSSYVLIYQSFLLPVFFSTVLASQGVSLASWGLVNGVSTVLGVILAVLAGKYADKNERLHVLKKMIWLAFFGMAALSFSITDAKQYIPYIFIFTNAIFIATISISDSILTFISRNEKDTFGNSGFGWGFGYVGGIICLVMVLVLQKRIGEYAPGVFLSVAIFYIAFSLFSMNGMRGLNLNASTPEDRAPLKHLSKINKLILLTGFWLIAESITITILFYSIYASSELKLNSDEIAKTLLIIQVIAFPATWFGGKLGESKKYSWANHGNLLGITIGIWIGLILYLSFAARDLNDLYIVAVLTGLVIGNSQSYMRSFYSMVVDKGIAGEEFGFYAIITQAAVLIGAWGYGYASDLLGSQRVPMVVVTLFMLIGYILIKWTLSIQNKVE